MHFLGRTTRSEKNLLSHVIVLEIFINSNSLYLTRRQFLLRLDPIMYKNSNRLTGVFDKHLTQSRKIKKKKSYNRENHLKHLVTAQH